MSEHGARFSIIAERLFCTRRDPIPGEVIGDCSMFSDALADKSVKIRIHLPYRIERA
jgi:hypothetical protein